MTGEILFLSHRPPWPPDRGDKIRSWHLLERLARLAPVHLVCLADDDAEAATPPPPGLELASCRIEPRRIGKPAAAISGLAGGRPLLLSLFDSAVLRDHVRSLIETRPITCVMAYSIQMAQFVPDLDDSIRFVMDFVDVDSAKFESYARGGNPLMRFIYKREARLLAAYEYTVAHRADLGLFVSDAEAGLFRERAGLGDDRIRALCNGVDLAYFDPAGDHQRPDLPAPLIIFTGQMDYRPNVEAVMGFAHDVMPRIRMNRPDARFAIVGRRPDPAVQALAQLPGVIVTGEVPDVRGWLAAADVVVAPLGIARGVQNKVLEAMAMARPVVASPAAFEGIEARPGEELLVADGAQAQADAVLRLLDDPAWANMLGMAARARIEADYGWGARLAPLSAMVGLTDAPLMAAAE
jgi:sugar transferase (PEP-CTERM/EpsH1 system associated)